MIRKPANRKAQCGAALIIFVTILILGISWFTVGALGKAGPGTAEREAQTGIALQSAKRALLSHIAQQAARAATLAYASQTANFTVGQTVTGATSGATAQIAADADNGATGTLTLKNIANGFVHSETVTDGGGGSAAANGSSGSENPGQMPCPEATNSIGGANEGMAAFNCLNVAAVGRLPWRTLGIDQLRDGWGEPLWYALSGGFRSAPINFGTAAALPFEGGTTVVAVIIAPGVALNTAADTGVPPASCAKINQQTNRYASPLDLTKFLECGNATGTVANPYANPGTSQWTNDRVIAITAMEWADAIAAGVADRLQRQVAPALNDWRATQSLANWGTSFLPYASTFGLPAGNDLCGDLNVLEGITPIASASSSTCSSWSGTAGTWSVAALLGSIDLIFVPPSCAQSGTSLVCTFRQWVGTPLTTRITATAPGVGMSFRAPITSANITNNRGGVNSNFSNLLSSATGQTALRVDIAFPVLGFLTVVTVTITNLPDAAILSDTRMTWFVNNQWGRYTYYAVGQGAKLGAASPCAGAGDPDCLTLNGLPASNGNTNDKRFVLTLMGRAVGAQTQPSANPTDYLESHTVGTAVHTYATTTSTFNDRQAACPFQQTPATGTPAVLCN